MPDESDEQTSAQQEAFVRELAFKQILDVFNRGTYEMRTKLAASIFNETTKRRRAAEAKGDTDEAAERVSMLADVRAMIDEMRPKDSG